MTDPATLWDDSANSSPEMAAARAIGRARDSHLADLDKLRTVLLAGGTFLEMKAAVNAYQVIDNLARELDKAAKAVVAEGVSS